MSKYQVSGIYKYEYKSYAHTFWEIYQVIDIKRDNYIYINVLDGNTIKSDFFVLNSMKDKYSKIYIDWNKELENV